MISFNKTPYTGSEDRYVLEVIQRMKLNSDGYYSNKCQLWFENGLPATKTLLTPSCTAALELSAMLIGIKPGDEVIMPSFTFPSTANAFALRGAKIVFVDIRPDTLNIDEQLIEAAITSNTRAIVPVHYAGTACEMDAIMAIAEKHDLYVIEDAAQGMMSTYKGRSLGTIGHIGTFSFHYSKNYTSGGEGGLLIINEANFLDQSQIIREKGTNRHQFLNGKVKKYSWVDLGSSYLLSELQAAYLWGQLESAEKINQFRISAWNLYYKYLMSLSDMGHVELASHPSDCKHNGHIFYIKVKTPEERNDLILFLNNKGLMALSHYEPLHSSAAGKKYGYFAGEDRFTTRESERLLRLPIWYGISPAEQKQVVDAIFEFYA